jgi:hypothetical protein
MHPATEPPDSIAELGTFLASMGAPLQSVTFSSPNNQILIGATAGGCVRVAADRGQWFVELAAPGSDDYFDSSVWAACLSDTPVSLEVEPLEKQVKVIEALVSDGSALTVSTARLKQTRSTMSEGRQSLLAEQYRIQAKRGNRPSSPST